jgi:phosphate transport system permease protein
VRLAPDLTEKIAKGILWIFAFLSAGILVFIIGYVVLKGVGTIDLEFLTAPAKDMGRRGGVFPFVVSTIYVTFVSLMLSVPLGVGTAIYLCEYVRENPLTRIIRFGVDCLAGVPSIIFGLFGFMFFVVFLDLGWSILSGGLTVMLMMVPFIIGSSEEAIRAVPKSYRQVSLSLSATRWQTVTRVVLLSALPGILTGIILGIGKCVGETASLIFTAGSSLRTLPLCLILVELWQFTFISLPEREFRWKRPMGVLVSSSCQSS